jgi:hypothetical protein
MLGFHFTREPYREMNGRKWGSSHSSKAAAKPTVALANLFAELKTALNQIRRSSSTTTKASNAATEETLPAILSRIGSVRFANKQHGWSKVRVFSSLLLHSSQKFVSPSF